MSKQIIIGVIAVAVIGIGIGGWFYFSKSQKMLPTGKEEAIATPQSAQEKSGASSGKLTTTEKITARSFAEKVLKLLQNRDYGKIYDLLTEEDKAAITRTEYVKQATEASGAVVITNWQIKEVLEEQGGASVQYVANYTNPVLGASSETGILTLVQTNGKWFLSLGAIDVANAVIRGVGDEIVLATMKFKVNAVREQQTISNQYGSSASAKEGTRFVVIDLTITNTTKSSVMFPTEAFVLEDNQDRKFEIYGNTIGNIDNYLNVRDLSPSIPERGVVVYEIPLDTASYNYVVAKAGTNEVYKIILK